MTCTRTEFECAGKVRLGAVSSATEQALARLGGEWLEYSLDEGAVVVCHVQPDGPPALSTVPAELIAILDVLDPAERQAIPGGAMMLSDRNGILLRLVVEGGEIRIQWPREDWSKAIPIDVDAALSSADPFSARISGTARLSAPDGAETRLATWVDGFEGLYPAGELEVTRDGPVARVELRAVNVGPAQLLEWLHHLAQPAESLEAELDIGSFVPHAGDRDFRLTVHGGVVRAVRPSLWPDN